MQERSAVFGSKASGGNYSFKFNGRLLMTARFSGEIVLVITFQSKIHGSGPKSLSGTLSNLHGFNLFSDLTFSNFSDFISHK